MTRPLVIGIGNPFRHDDGVGLAVLDRIALDQSVPADVVEELGEPAALVERWTGRDLVVVVDAVVSGAEPGTVVSYELGATAEPIAVPPPKGSSHALGIGDAVELGRALGRFPQRLLFVGVEAADTSAGFGLSPAVAAAVEAVAAVVRAAVGGAT